MTIRQALENLDSSKFNTVSQAQKIAWLSRLDMLAAAEIFSAYDDCPADFAGYDAETDLDTQLLIGAPYDEIYGYWLESRVDYENGEFSQFNNSNAMYENIRQRFADHYLRSHMPKNKGQFY